MDNVDHVTPLFKNVCRSTNDVRKGNLVSVSDLPTSSLTQVPMVSVEKFSNDYRVIYSPIFYISKSVYFNSAESHKFISKFDINNKTIKQYALNTTDFELPAGWTTSFNLSIGAAECLGYEDNNFYALLGNNSTGSFQSRIYIMKYNSALDKFIQHKFIDFSSILGSRGIASANMYCINGKYYMMCVSQKGTLGYTYFATIYDPETNTVSGYQELHQYPFASNPTPRFNVTAITPTYMLLDSIIPIVSGQQVAWDLEMEGAPNIVVVNNWFRLNSNVVKSAGPRGCYGTFLINGRYYVVRANTEIIHWDANEYPIDIIRNTSTSIPVGASTSSFAVQQLGTKLVLYYVTPTVSNMKRFFIREFDTVTRNFVTLYEVVLTNLNLAPFMQLDFDEGVYTTLGANLSNPALEISSRYNANAITDLRSAKRVGRALNTANTGAGLVVDMWTK